MSNTYDGDVEIVRTCLRTAKQLAASPTDAPTWQRLADNSKVVSESIKRLVAAIREEAPGQVYFLYDCFLWYY